MASTTRRFRQTSMHVVSISLDCGAGAAGAADVAVGMGGAAVEEGVGCDGWVERGMALVAPQDSRRGRICFPMGVFMRRYIEMRESFLPVVDL